MRGMTFTQVLWSEGASRAVASKSSLPGRSCVVRIWGIQANGNTGSECVHMFADLVEATTTFPIGA